ncbi:MAG: bifunctional demethylmenaquinone methyltransferase/2-methoxy-6-polyprenyl-1,4-benzoquinol methylase UbiE [Acidiferrobacterales bacterium]
MVMRDREGNTRTTHFGFRSVPESAKAGLVGGVFDSVAERYDLMNDLMSLGMHRLWKRFTVAQSGVRAGHTVLDLAGGTGDLARAFTGRVGSRGRVVIVDINASMLAVGRQRLADNGIAGNVDFVQANGERLPFPDESFDCVSVGFGLRNMTHMDHALVSMARVLKPGGCLMVLEFSRPTQPLVGKLYDAYSFSVLPFLGRYVADDERSYRYLAESIRQHPDQEALKTLMKDAGFTRVHYFNLTAGIVALHKAYKL